MPSIILSLIPAVLAFVAGVSATTKACTITTLSCTNTTAIADTCCFNAPGGQILQTQFWDTAPSLGPVDSWTIHGLWPDRCDGTYEANCDSSRAYTGSVAALTAAGETDLLNYLQTYWKDNTFDDPSFWEYEWAKHGTCISTLKPSCYTSYTAKEELIDFYQTTADLFATRDTYAILAAAGITPKSSGTYAASAIQAALAAYHGKGVIINCASGSFNEVWYQFNVRGSVQTGEFVPSAPVGSGSTCSGNVSYKPKAGTPTTTTTAPTSTSTGIFSGTGTLVATTGGTATGCLISAGTWYVSGTCATYTAAASGTGFTLTSSKGACGVTGGAFVCSSTTTAAVFTSVGGKLAYGGVSVWYASAVPSGSTQISIYTTTSSGRLTAVTIAWT